MMIFELTIQESRNSVMGTTSFRARLVELREVARDGANRLMAPHVENEWAHDRVISDLEMRDARYFDIERIVREQARVLADKLVEQVVREQFRDTVRLHGG
jgi:hypothetical protein